MRHRFVRLDKLIVDRKLLESRTLAQEYIEAGRVTVEGLSAVKPASQVSPEVSIKIDAPEKVWVSRGAHKLLKAVEAFHLNIEGKTCLDIGASTGGFTDVLLHYGAAKVYAVDVGYGQLAWKLRNDNKVVVMERTNARFLNINMLNDEKADIIVSDASFISLKLLLPTLQNLLKDDGVMTVLVKPQFEVGRERVGNGVITDSNLHYDVLNELSSFIKESTSLLLIDATFSPIRGPEGNIEFLFLMGLASGTKKTPQDLDFKLLAEEAKKLTEASEHEDRTMSYGNK